MFDTFSTRARQAVFAARSRSVFGGYRPPTFPFEARCAAVLSWSFWSNTGDTEVPASERKTESVPSALVQGHRGVDAHLWSRAADRGARAGTAARPPARQHAPNQHPRRRPLTQHRSKH